MCGSFLNRENSQYGVMKELNLENLGQFWWVAVIVALIALLTVVVVITKGNTPYAKLPSLLFCDLL